MEPTAPDSDQEPLRLASDLFHRLYWQAVLGSDQVRLQLWERLDLTLPQLRVLFYLRRQPGATVRDLSRRLGVTMPTASEQVQKMVERGLVERRQHPTDRREIPLVLSERGAALTDMAREEAFGLSERLAAALGDDLPAVLAALERLGEAFERVQLSDDPLPATAIERPTRRSTL